MMVKLRNLTQRYPIVFAAVMTLAYVGISQLVSFLVAFVPKGYAADAIFEVAHMFWPVAVAILLGYGFALKEKGFGKTFHTNLHGRSTAYISKLICLSGASSSFKTAPAVGTVRQR